MIPHRIVLQRMVAQRMVLHRMVQQRMFQQRMFHKRMVPHSTPEDDQQLNYLEHRKEMVMEGRDGQHNLILAHIVKERHSHLFFVFLISSAVDFFQGHSSDAFIIFSLCLPVFNHHQSSQLTQSYVLQFLHCHNQLIITCEYLSCLCVGTDLLL